MRTRIWNEDEWIRYRDKLMTHDESYRFYTTWGTAISIRAHQDFLLLPKEVKEAKVRKVAEKKLKGVYEKQGAKVLVNKEELVIPRVDNKDIEDLKRKIAKEEEDMLKRQIVETNATLKIEDDESKFFTLEASKVWQSVNKGDKTKYCFYQNKETQEICIALDMYKDDIDMDDLTYLQSKYKVISPAYTIEGRNGTLQPVTNDTGNKDNINKRKKFRSNNDTVPKHSDASVIAQSSKKITSVSVDTSTEGTQGISTEGYLDLRVSRIMWILSIKYHDTISWYIKVDGKQRTAYLSEDGEDGKNKGGDSMVCKAYLKSEHEYLSDIKKEDIDLLTDQELKHMVIANIYCDRNKRS